ncbi:MAG: triose-phosphate isomerase [Porticoccaceae bacterium]
MRKPLVVGNWKMHGRRASVAALVGSIIGDRQGGSAEVVVCPPSVFLADVAAQIMGAGVALGAQDLSEYDEGAYTGDVSGAMLKDFGCQYVIVGHSERRFIFGETDVRVVGKFAAAQRWGLTPILCVGESLAEREAGSTLVVIRNQLQAVVNRVGRAALASAVIAYEPVWAIGSGRTATPTQAQDVHRAIRAELGEYGAATPILYGGSVKAANVAELLCEDDIDGVLVGGAALNADEFNAICAIADRN